jgi:hypothetical protein
MLQRRTAGTDIVLAKRRGWLAAHPPAHRDKAADRRGINADRFDRTQQLLRRAREMACPEAQLVVFCQLYARPIKGLWDERSECHAWSLSMPSVNDREG